MLADHLASLLDFVPHDPWPRHSDHTGASLAVRGDVYAAVGGIPPLPFREDIGFVARRLLRVIVYVIRLRLKSASPLASMGVRGAAWPIA